MTKEAQGQPETHGYSGRTLAQKLGIKPHCRLLTLDAPETYRGLLSDVADSLPVHRPNIEEADVIHVFCRDSSALDLCARQVAPNLAAGAILWVSWEKKRRAFQPEINREDVRKRILETGLVDVKVCSVDAQWSALKFLHRKKDKS